MVRQNRATMARARTAVKMPRQQSRGHGRHQADRRRRRHDAEETQAGGIEQGLELPRGAHGAPYQASQACQSQPEHAQARGRWQQLPQHGW